ncbi:MAG: ATP-dependent Clp protease adaptor ClpS [Lentisphaeria bacterium]|nr:ATP-dependent Clp protease adaptor ClpS [Lentisphaeria bacterium]
MFRVLLHNDDYTTVDFVVAILVEVFLRPLAEAIRITQAVHERGAGVAGVYPYEIAETKVHRVHQLAKAGGFPLKCSIEQE